MIETVNQAIDTYKGHWDELVAGCTNQAFFNELKLTSVGWKVEDEATYRAICAELHGQSDQLVETFMNGRWVTKVHLGNTALHQGIEIIKVMQRRPGSEDAVGLDHVDFYCPSMAEAVNALTAEPSIEWSRQTNDVIEGYPWLSVWFNDTEAKIKDYTVLDIVRAELQDLNARIKGRQP